MPKTLLILLMLQGVRAFPGVAIGLEATNRDDLLDLYGEAFENTGDPEVIVVIGGRTETIFIIDSLEMLWRNIGEFSESEIDVLLCIREELWEKMLMQKPKELEEEPEPIEIRNLIVESRVMA